MQNQGYSHDMATPAEAKQLEAVRNRSAALPLLRQVKLLPLLVDTVKTSSATSGQQVPAIPKGIEQLQHLVAFPNTPNGVVP